MMSAGSNYMKRDLLNKGPYVAAANHLLAGIVRKMEAHQYKKRALYRPLSLVRGGTSRWELA